MLANYGCNLTGSTELNEVKITYEVTYPELSESEVLQNKLPDEIVFYFSNNKMCSEITFGNGVMTKLISDSVARTYYTLIHSPKQKQARIYTEKDVTKNFQYRVPLKITYTENTKEIAGLICKEAVCFDSAENNWSVYYSDNIKAENPNWASAYGGINGVMLEYPININNLMMNLKAKSIDLVKFNPNQFSIPDDYKINLNYRKV